MSRRGSRASSRRPGRSASGSTTVYQVGRIPLRHGEGGRRHLNSVQGLAALSLDALSSVAYGPEAALLVLAGAGAAAIGSTLPITLAIVGLLAVLVVSYRQVIAAHPDGGGSYAVARSRLGGPVSLLAAAALIVDYVLTVAVSLAAGAASLASAFPVLTPYLLETCLAGLALLAAVNLFGIAESARVLMLPTVLFVGSILGVVALGLAHSHPAAVVGTPTHAPVVETLGVLLVLKAFSAGCSALTGVEAVANGVPVFREPRVRRAQRTELMLGVLLGLMLVGLAVLIHRYHVQPRGNVTVLAQLIATAYGTGWPYYATNIVVTLTLALAANTSFGGMPVLMSRLAEDDRLPHLFELRTERPVHRYGVVAVAVSAAVLLVAVDAQTHRLIPLFAVGVFTGFTISQVGLVRHWVTLRPRRWLGRVLLNGAGAVLTFVATAVLLITKFWAGAWVVVVVVPLLMLLFARIQRYYARAGEELGLGRTPPRPVPSSVATGSARLIVIPIADISIMVERALSTALALGGEVVAVAVRFNAEEAEELSRRWLRWDPGVRLEIIENPHRTVVGPVVHYVREAAGEGRWVIVLIPSVEPWHLRYEILHNQREVFLAACLQRNTDVLVCLLPFRLSV
ncbi:Amino acid transporter [Thermomonospora echinospora]|uniref:Amino acid transporter n=1 Tax=Thermomonospora echinospora TaxID=1992 RepID=A0A1H6CF68_9ACTN|nr:amino acid permease [Thermomonospora echinospora]SEG70986.1 Amino acid transporter [Thermomonospora echinospora]